MTAVLTPVATTSTPSTPAPAMEHDDDIDSNVSFSGFSDNIGSSGGSVTSYDDDNMSTRSPSPTPSTWSATSSFLQRQYREEHGRKIHAWDFPDGPYRLPADDEEWRRLDKQHYMLRRVLKMPSHFHRILTTNRNGETRQVLDLGCGSGTWIFEVARAYTSSQCVAVDLAPLSVDMPPNCRSEMDNINLGLEHFYNNFDIVHARLISSGIKDYGALIHQMSHTLRPGGLIELCESDFRVYDEDKCPIYCPSALDPASDAPLRGPWFPLWVSFVNKAVRKAGGNIDAANLLNRWVCSNNNFDQRTVEYNEYFLPTAPFYTGTDERSQWLNDLGSMMRDDIKEFLRAARPLLLSQETLPPEKLEYVEQQAELELDQCRYRTFMRLEHVWALRRDEP